MKTYLGIDIGGTAVKLGLVTENGEVLCRAETSVSFDGYKTPILDTVRKAAACLLAESRAEGQDPAGAGCLPQDRLTAARGLWRVPAGACPAGPAPPSGPPWRQIWGCR